MSAGITLNVILASSSPRRADILKCLGLTFKVCRPDTDERTYVGRNPSEFVQSCAEEKTKNVAQKITYQTDTLIMAADTAVVLGSYVFGKPQTKEDALTMLRALSGKTHKVLTGVSLCLYESKSKAMKKKVFYDTTRVTFKKLNISEIKNYVRTGEPMDKAGAYAIQEKGASFVKSIQGCYFNVVGLPVYKLGFALKELGRSL